MLASMDKYDKFNKGCEGLLDLSLCSMEGLTVEMEPCSSNCDDETPIETAACLQCCLKKVYCPKLNLTWDQKKERIFNILKRVDLSSAELNKVGFWDQFSLMSLISFIDMYCFYFISTHIGMLKRRIPEI